jgi:hypothetical protein
VELEELEELVELDDELELRELELDSLLELTELEDDNELDDTEEELSPHPISPAELIVKSFQFNFLVGYVSIDSPLRTISTSPNPIINPPKDCQPSS